MIFKLLCLYLFAGIQLQLLLATEKDDINFSDKIMCDYRGGFEESSKLIPDTDPSCIPQNCEVMIYTRFSIDMKQQINVDYDAIAKVKSLNKPLIVRLNRQYDYVDWVDLITENGNEKDAAALCDFAIKNNIDGFLLSGIAPRCYDTLNSTFTTYLPTYLKQLKCNPKFIIGISVEGYSPFIKNPCVYDFASLNSLVDFYEIHTFALNACDPKIYNGRIPLLTRKHGTDYILSMEEVKTFVQASQMTYSKAAYTIEMFPIDSVTEDYSSYHQVCTCPIECNKWCIQTTKDFYNKAKFVKNEKCGVIVKWINLDDTKDACGCGPFIGFNNIVAGYKGGNIIPCEKFDIQANFLNVPE